jgi:TPR repeat protein
MDEIGKPSRNADAKMDSIAFVVFILAVIVVGALAWIYAGFGMRFVGFVAKENRQYHSAHLWFERAIAAGDVEAMAELARLYDHGNGVKLDRAKARAW